MMAVCGLLLSALAALSCLGWGRLVDGRAGLAWPVAATLGLAVVVALGGLLNLAGMAFGWALDGVAAIGLILAGWTLWRRPPRAPSARGLAIAALALIPAGFVAATQLPITLFDFLDDFSKYFAYPMRMLATGTLAGSSLNSMGAETLGGQAFLDGFVLAHWPFSAINAVDGVFGLMLCGLMLGRTPRAAVIGVIALAVVPNQYVNVSTLYLGAALIMAELLVLTDDQDGLPPPLAAALPAAALIALKASFAPLAVAMLAFAAIGFGWRDGWRSALAWAGRTGGAAVLALAPWLAVHRANLLAWAMGQGGLAEAPIIQAAPSGDPLAMLSFKALPYGGSYGAYSVLLAAIVAMALLAAFPARRRAPGLLAVALALALVSVGLLQYTLPRDFAHFTLRYTIPALLGVLLGLLVVAEQVKLGLRTRVVLALLGLAPLALFGAEAPARWERMIEGKSMLAFHWLADLPDFQAFSTAMVEPAAFAHLQAIQARIPAGEPLLVWVTTPFQLDYARNPIIDADYAGLATPWARLPEAGWVLWEVKGWAVTGRDSYARDGAAPMDYVARQGRRAVALTAQLENAANHSEVAYFDGRFVLFHLSRPLGDFPATLGAR